MELVERYPWLLSRWLAGLVYIFCIAVVMYPVSLSPFSLIVGHEQATAGCHVWVLWWAQQGVSNINTELIFFPYGGDVMKLYGSDVLSPLLFSWIPISPIFLYNFWVSLLFFIGAMGIRELALYEKCHCFGALVAGVVFLSSPFLLHELLNGTSEIIACGFVPWFVLYFRKTLEGDTLSSAFLLGIFASLSLMSSVYNAFFLLFFAGGILVFLSCTYREPIFSSKIVWKVLISVGVFLPFAGLVAWLQIGHGAKETASRREDWLSTDILLPDSYASIEDWIDPQDIELPALMMLPDGSSFEYWTLCTVYIGWCALLLAIWSLREKMDLYFWCGSIALLVAMGPYLRYQGDLVGDMIELPLTTLVYIFPPLSIVALHAYRFAAIVVICISIGVARSVRNPWWICIILMEALWISPVPYPTSSIDVGRSNALMELQKEPEGAVLSVPVAMENLHDLSQALVAQTTHQKPIQDGGIHRRIGSEATGLFTENTLVGAMAHREKPILIDTAEADQSIKELCMYGYRYILLKNGDEELDMWFEKWLGMPQSVDDEWSWWKMSVCNNKEIP